MREKIAFRSHETRGEDIIKILEGMGGVNKYNLDGSKGIITIDYLSNKSIINDRDYCDLLLDGWKIYNLEAYENKQKLSKQIKNMKYFYVEVDTNDADYIGKIVKVEDESAEKFKPLIEKIKNFKPYIGFSKLGSKFTHDCNFPYGECLRDDLGEKHPCELYDIDEDTYEEFVDTFKLYGGEWGFHTIEKIQEVTLGKTWLNTK